MSKEELRKAIQDQLNNRIEYDFWWDSAILERIQYILDPVGEKDKDLWRPA